VESEYLLVEMPSNYKQVIKFREEARQTAEGFLEIGVLEQHWTFIPGVDPAIKSVLSSTDGYLSVSEDPDDHTQFCTLASRASSFLRILEAFREFHRQAATLKLPGVDEPTFQSEKHRAIGMLSVFYGVLSDVDPLILAAPNHYWFLNDWVMDQGLYRNDTQDHY
jgi:hypothetical protein